MSNQDNIKHLTWFTEYYHNKSNRQLRNKLFYEYEFLANIAVKKYSRKGIEEDELYQIASLALIQAIERFDPYKGYEFTTFATPTIMGELKKFFRDKSRVVRVPRKLQILYTEVEKAKEVLSQTNQKTPTIKEISNHLEIGEDEVLEAMEFSGMIQWQDSQEEWDLFQCEQSLKAFEQLEDKTIINQLFETLNDLEKTIINQRYLLDQQSQKQIADDLKLSQVTISRIEKKVLQKLRKALDHH